MDISCDIIRDLLPLYAEELTSQDSNELVEEHLCRCDPCTKQLAILKKVQIVPVDVDTKSLKRVWDTIKRRRILAVLTVLLLVASIWGSVYTYMNVPIALTADEAVVSFEKTEDGGICHTLYEYAYMMHAREYGSNKGYIYQTTRSRMWDWENSPYPYQTIQSYEYGTVQLEDGTTRPYFSDSTWPWQGEITELAVEQNHWYLNIYDGTPETILWDGGAETPSKESFMEPNYVLAYLAVSCVVLSFGLWAASGRVKKPWVVEMMQRISVFAASIVYATVLVCGERYVCLDGLYEMRIRFEYILCLSAVVALTALFARQVYKLNKQDKGQ